MPRRPPPRTPTGGEILGLYDMLVALAPNPMTRLNRVVALAMVDGPAAGLLALDTVTDPTLAGHHRSHAVRAHLLEEIGDLDGARREYEVTAGLTHSLPERQHLLERAARCRDVSAQRPRPEGLREPGAA